MRNKLRLPIISMFLFLGMHSFCQEVKVADVDGDDIPFAVIEQVPVYPGCKGDNKKLLKYCLNYSIKKHISVHFNIKKALNIGLKGSQKIFVQFKIMKTGKVKIVGVRAPHKRLEKEARRVVNKLPKMIPGKQKGKPVNVTYMLPISFRVE